jgi:hypothetical protein
MINRNRLLFTGIFYAWILISTFSNLSALEINLVQESTPVAESASPTPTQSQPIPSINENIQDSKIMSPLERSEPIDSPKHKATRFQSAYNTIFTVFLIIISFGVICIFIYFRNKFAKIDNKLKKIHEKIETSHSRAITREKTLGDLKAAEIRPPTSEIAYPSKTAPSENESFPEGYLHAGDSLKGIRKKMPKIFMQATDLVQHGKLPLIGWSKKEKIQQLPIGTETFRWFFIGDIHGDFLALHRLLERALGVKDSRICFLGDLVDRGPHDLECFALILQTAINHPDRIMWIIGNHDEGLSFNSESKKFSSSVEPAEIVDLLNSPPADLDATKVESWGRLFIDIVAGLPRAVLFSDGLLATHGGIPLEDRWSTLKSLADLESPGVRSDFTWTRATSAPTKKGWKYDPAKRKTSSNFEFGYRDLEGFCKAVESFFPVKRIVRGHDHVESGWEVPNQYQNVPILTINGCGFHYLSGSYENYADGLTLAAFRKDQLPEVEFVTFFRSEHRGCSEKLMSK